MADAPDAEVPNRAQREHWDRLAGPVWVRFQAQLDRQIAPYGERVLEALAPAPGERILDVGCGCGDSSLALARAVGPEGEVVGVDPSAPMLARAEARAREAGLGNLRFLQRDAQTADLGEGRFDAVASRFGVMFFEDPHAAFANLRRALRPGGRVAFVCWQAAERNAWIAEPMAAVAPFLELPPPPEPGAPGMFSLAAPERVRGILEGAGLADVTLREASLATRPGGGDVEEAVATFLEVGPVARLLQEQEAGPDVRARVEAAVRARFAAADAGDGPRFASAAWIVTARRPDRP